jgi:flavin reductase (DIM6/NTAB) family NADH-FMN oxidoreductase RutF
MTQGRDIAALVGDLDYPLLIVTAEWQSEFSGCAVGFSTQASIDPCRFVVCLSHENRTFEIATKARHLAVHFVPAEQRELAEIFASITGDSVDKFELCEWKPGPHGLPILSGCPNFFIGRIADRADFGDHDGFVLEPETVGRGGPMTPLAVRELADVKPGHEP